MADVRFYETTYTIHVLSDQPIPGTMDLSEVLYEAENGDYVSDAETMVQRELTPKQMVDALCEVGSDPEFFGLDDDGNLLED